MSGKELRIVSFRIIFDEPAFPDLADKMDSIVQVEGGLALAVIDNGTNEGRPAVALRYDLPDGTPVLAQTTARLFCGAARAIMARYPDLFED